MLELKKINKTYQTGNLKQQALNNISINFRQSEFVSILGPSGSGKTTLLNIIGGLDNYTSGDLVINGISTKRYKDRDWDTYRNHKIGFVFQNYNLISHQSILTNVELSLTLSGIPKKERIKKAKSALKKVGLEKHIHKRPNQLSGGQMQRVAIARALVNDPDILLADEPTGALDSKTSVQIMDLLKEVAQNKLVIMVTHNSELAHTYSTRIIELKDGKITNDTNYYDSKNEKKENTPDKKTNMNFKTALGLSLNNLLTKKGRTILTAFAGSIGIIGIALILSLSNGVQNYINRVEEDTLSSYPITIQKSQMDISVMMEAVMNMQNKNKDYEDNKVHPNAIMNEVLDMMSSNVNTNNLEEFKKHLDNNKKINNYTNDIQYGYDITLNIYNENGQGGITRVNPAEIMEKLGMEEMANMQENFGSYSSANVWEELLDNKDLLKEQYDLVKGSWPSKYNEVVIMLDENGNLSDYTLYALGLLDSDELSDKFKALMNGQEAKKSNIPNYSYDELLNMEFKLILSPNYYQKKSNMWIDKSNDEEYIKEMLKDSEKIKVSGIIRPNENSIINSPYGGVGYTKDLQNYVIEKTNETAIVQQQKNNKNINVFTGVEFTDKEFNYNDLSDKQKMYLASLSSEEAANVINNFNENYGATYESNAKKLGITDISSPTSINIYPKDFASKEDISSLIDEYNQKQTNKDKEENVISYSDIVGTMMSSVTTIVNIISYVLMAFVSISLIVSSIMIGIITYISVLERTKEIGILRSIGASKKDISRVFNAETFIIGLISGIIGILITLLLLIPINIILANIIGVTNIASLPFIPAIILIIISVILTIIAGLIPAKMASKKDPVEALRTE